MLYNYFTVNYLALLWLLLLLLALLATSEARYSDYISTLTIPYAQDYFGTPFVQPQTASASASASSSSEEQ